MKIALTLVLLTAKKCKDAVRAVPHVGGGEGVECELGIILGHMHINSCAFSY